MSGLLLHFRFCVASLLLTALVVSPVAADEEKITYDQHILPIFREKCGTCHNPNDKKGDLVLDNYAATMRGGASGDVVRTDGDADGSSLYRVVAHLSEPKMPPNQPRIPDPQLALIKKWIEQGALENSGSKARAKKTTTINKVEVSNQRPAGPPTMPEGLPLESLSISPRANGVTALANSPWAPLMAVSGHKQILLYETSTLDLLGVLPYPEGQPHALKFSRNGQLLLAAGGRGAALGKAVVFDVKTGQRVAEVGSEYDVCLAGDISADHTLVALGGPKKMVRVYTLDTGELLYEKKKHTDWITAIEFSPDGVLLATGDRSNGLVVWEAVTGREFYVLNGHQGTISDVSWSGDGNLLASASEDTTVKVWEMQNGGMIKNFGTHGGGATSVDFTRDGRLVTTGRDNTAKLWDINGAQQRAFGGLADIGTDIIYCAETDRLLVGDLTGTITAFHLASNANVGTCSTNPPARQARIDALSAQLTAATAAAEQATAALSAIQRGIDERNAAAAAAKTAAAQAQADRDAAAKLKADADAAVSANATDENQQAAQLAATKLQAATTTLAEAQTKHEQANAAAQISPELQQQLTNATQASAAAAENVTRLQFRIARQRAEHPAAANAQ